MYLCIFKETLNVLMGEDYATNISNGRFKPASAKHSSNVKDEFIEFLIKTYKTLSFKLCNAFALYGLGLPGWYGSTTSAAIDVLHKTLGLSVHRYHLGDTADIFSVILSTGISLFVVCLFYIGIK